MTATRDQKILFTALGFTAVILSGAPKDKQAQRALAVAQLIEDFCMDAVGDEPAQGQSENKNVMRDALSALEQSLKADDGEQLVDEPRQSQPR